MLSLLNLKDIITPPSFNSKKTRTPASVLAGNFLKQYKPSSEIIYINCKRDLTFNVNVDQVRFKLKNCGLLKQTKNITISNLDNSYSATVFKMENEISTDYISLIPGKNRISVNNQIKNLLNISLNYQKK